jgi:hypothetical protein
MNSTHYERENFQIGSENFRNLWFECGRLSSNADLLVAVGSDPPQGDGR